MTFEWTGIYESPYIKRGDAEGGLSTLNWQAEKKEEEEEEGRGRKEGDDEILR